MKQIRFTRVGDPHVLELFESADPTPSAGQVRIRTEAAGVNFADLMARMGIYPDAPPLPSVVGYEVAGTIDAVGDGVDTSRIGEPVIAMCRFGGYSTHVLVDDIQAVRRPDGLDAIHGASIPVTGLTAWMMLEEMGRVREGDRVLVHSAGGGVGLMALELIKFRGATAIGTASARKHDFLRERGYDQLIDYRNQDFADVLRDEPPLDLVLDPVGGASWTKGLDLLHPGGRLICFGMSSNATSEQRSLMAVIRNMLAVPWLRVNPISLMNENRGVMGVNMGHMWDERERVTAWLAALMARWADGHLRTHVHATVPFSNAPEAHRILHDRENFGKVILVPDDA
jgi:NADPH:quinone reductase-like Zn-dependent oxidoreductase